MNQTSNPMPPDDSELWDKLDALVSMLAAEEVDGHDVVLVRHGRLHRFGAGATLVTFAQAIALQELGFLEVDGGGSDGRAFTVRVTEKGRYQRDRWAKRVYREFKKAGRQPVRL